MIGKISLFKNIEVIDIFLYVKYVFLKKGGYKNLKLKKNYDFLRFRLFS